MTREEDDEVAHLTKTGEVCSLSPLQWTETDPFEEIINGPAVLVMGAQA